MAITVTCNSVSPTKKAITECYISFIVIGEREREMRKKENIVRKDIRL